MPEDIKVPSLIFSLSAPMLYFYLVIYLVCNASSLIKVKSQTLSEKKKKLDSDNLASSSE